MKNNIPPLETITGKDLLTQTIEPLGFTIDGILPHGLFILAGSPKVGKSWLALDMCRAVANGEPFWNYSTTQGNALYLALEDTKARLQERLNKVSPICDLDIKTDIHFTTHAEKLGYGLSEQITRFLDAHPRTKLIVIDTMLHVRNTGKANGTYAKDYQDMLALREIISSRKVTLLLITHPRKAGSSDPLNTISGSTGLTGGVDGVFVLEKDKRIGNAAKLTIANRDTESHQFDLQFESADCRWQFVGESGAEDNENQLYDLLDFLLDETSNWCGTSTQLSLTLNTLEPTFSVSPIALSKLLKQQQDFLQSQYGIICSFGRTKKKRFIELSRIADGAIIVLPEDAYEVKAG